MLTRLLRNGAVLTIAGILLWLAASATPPAQAQFDNPPVSAADISTAAPLLVLYQARLLDPGSGQPKPDGTYPVTFGLYPVNSGGSAIWTETKNVALARGMFTTYLGDSSPLLPSYFDGQDLWLGIKISSDSEAAPRQHVAFTPYSAYAITAAGVTDPGVTHDDEVVPIVTGSGAFAGTGHTHQGETWTGSNPLFFSGSVSPAPLVISNSGGDGIQIQSAGDDGVQISGTNFGVYAYSTAYTGYTISGPGGNGVNVYSAGGNGVYATNSNASDTIYARNDGTGTAAGKALSAYSDSGAAGWFGTYLGGDLILAEEEVTRGNWDLRFRVKRWGDVLADGYFYGAGHLTGSADFAEMLPAVANLEPGDVLVVGIDGQLQRSVSANASNVAGAYSTSPGFVGGYEPAPSNAQGFPSAQSAQVRAAVESDKAAGLGAIAGSTAASPPGPTDGKFQSTQGLRAAAAMPGHVPLAVVGIVPVKASAENGGILPGDLLTTASVAGHAMKALPLDLAGVPIFRPGTILGKALEPLPTGTGVIRVLVTLQ